MSPTAPGEQMDQNGQPRRIQEILFPSRATHGPQETPTHFPGVGTLWVHFPGIPKVHGVFLHLEIAAGEVVVLDAIEIPTEATHLLLRDKEHGKPQGEF